MERLSYDGCRRVLDWPDDVEKLAAVPGNPTTSNVQMPVVRLRSSPLISRSRITTADGSALAPTTAFFTSLAV